MYGQCEVYGKKTFNIFKLLKQSMTKRQGYFEVHNKISLSVDSHEEEM